MLFKLVLHEKFSENSPSYCTFESKYVVKGFPLEARCVTSSVIGSVNMVISDEVIEKALKVGDYYDLDIEPTK